VRLLAESEQNEGEKGKSVRFSAQRPSPERALCVCVCVCVVAKFSFFLFVGEQKITKERKGAKKRETATHASLNSQLISIFRKNYSFEAS